MTDYSGAGFGGEVDWEGANEVANRSADTPKSAIATWDSNGDADELTGTQGDILYFGASGVVSKLGAGTTGQILKTAGAGANPTWEDALIPVGSVMPWLKSFTNTPALSGTTWVEMNGQVLSDAGSVYNGQTIPNLNGSSGTKRMLLGSTTSGTTGTIGASGTTSTVGASEGNGGAGAHSHTLTATVTNGDFYEVVWIMRVK